MTSGSDSRMPALKSIWKKNGSNRINASKPMKPRIRNEPSSAETSTAAPNCTVFGVIASTTAPFCRTCDRARLTADGTWLLCLYGDSGLDLRELLRMGASDEAIAGRIAATWRDRSDRGAEERAALADRHVLHQVESLRADPRREMHTRGG